MDSRRRPMNGDVVPAPALYIEKDGVCDISKGASICAPEAWRDEAGLLAGWLEKALGSRFAVTAAGPASRAAGRNSPVGEPEASLIVIKRRSPSPGEEWHEIDISSAGIGLTAETGAGLVRGAATIAQLALSGKGRIRSCRIEDNPRFSWRGLMLDTVRSYFSVEFIEKIIDLLALHKLNTFHMHLTDDQAWRLDLPFAPEAARRGARRLDSRYNLPRWREGQYDRADIARLVEFAKVRHVTLVPELETPGHATALLASHPEFSCRGRAESGLPFEPEDRFGVFEDILCAGNDAVMDFLSRALDALCEMFPGPYVHMGGDEAPKERWLSCPRCLGRMKALGFEDAAGRPDPERLQAWFMDKMAEMLAARGKRMVGWDEIMAGEARKDIAVMAWRGSDRIAEGAKAGYTMIACPQTKACYLDHKQSADPEEPGHLGICTLEDSYVFDPVPPGLSHEEEKRILGGQGNLWSELVYFGKQAEYMLFPRLCALAEVFWTPRPKRDYGDFLSRMDEHGGRLDAWGVNWRR